MLGRHIVMEPGEMPPQLHAHEWEGKRIPDRTDQYSAPSKL